MIFPPGTILQRMYLKERLKHISCGKFIEVGAGNGALSKLLCSQGWSGVGFELNPDALENASQNINSYISQNQYKILNENWLHTEFTEKVDLIISSMVIEHLNDEDELLYLKKCKTLLQKNGKAILFVPASLLYWGIEDEIAGHFRRYSFETLQALMQKSGWTISHMAGLTFPVSNLLFPISNFLVKRSENKKLQLNMQERTELSGNRDVLFKTTFPHMLKLFLNEIILYPFHLLQKLNKKNKRSMVIYLECEPIV